MTIDQYLPFLVAFAATALLAIQIFAYRQANLSEHLGYLLGLAPMALGFWSGLLYQQAALSFGSSAIIYMLIAYALGFVAGVVLWLVGFTAAKLS